MPVPLVYSSITPEHTNTSQLSLLQPLAHLSPPYSQSASEPDGSDCGTEDGAWLFDDIPPQTPSASTKDGFASEVKELARGTLESLLFAISPNGYNLKGVSDDRLLETARNRLRAFCFEKRVEIEQTLEPNDKNTVLIGSPTLKVYHFVCPFYVRQKEKYLSCLTRADLREIKDLKQHLWTVHRQSSYCPTCHDTFMLTEDWESHVRLKSCMSSGKPRPEGISALQMQRLAQCTDPWVSREVQWLLIWGIVFPGVKPPSLPYPFGEVEAVVWMLRDFWSAEGDRIVCGFLTERRKQTPLSQDDKRNAVTLGALVLNRVIDQLVAVCTRNGDDNEGRRRRGIQQTPSSWPSFWPW